MIDKGLLVMDLNDKAFFTIDKGTMTLYDRESGQQLLTLAEQPTLIWRLSHEIDRQRKGLVATGDAKDRWIYWMDWLSFMPGTADDQVEATNVRAMAKRLETAGFQLPALPSNAPTKALPPTPGALELFNGAWVMPAGNALAFETDIGRFEYLDPARGFFQDSSLGIASQRPYTPALRDLLAYHLGQQVKDEKATRDGINRTLADYNADINELNRDLAEYTEIQRSDGGATAVDYGTQRVSCQTAILLTNDALARSRATAGDLQQQLAALPATLELYRQLHERFVAAGAKP
jgi:hypothetical protein